MVCRRRIIRDFAVRDAELAEEVLDLGVGEEGVCFTEIEGVLGVLPEAGTYVGFATHGYYGYFVDCRGVDWVGEGGHWGNVLFLAGASGSGLVGGGFLLGLVSRGILETRCGSSQRT